MNFDDVAVVKLALQASFFEHATALVNVLLIIGEDLDSSQLLVLLTLGQLNGCAGAFAERGENLVRSNL